MAQHWTEDSSSDFGQRLNQNAADFLPRQHNRHRGGYGRGRGWRGNGGGRGFNSRRGTGRRMEDYARESEIQREDGGRNDNLRVSISDRLRSETYECMICCEPIRWTHAVWSCQLCYSVFHLRCAKRWASSCSGMQQDGLMPVATSEWRCPGCQSINVSVPNEYKCFCGKMNNPTHVTWSQRGNASVPHTCGELCLKRRGDNATHGCPHPCNELCHPGPCDLCPRTTDKKCLCGKETRRVRCGSEEFQCGQICGKKLNCSIHHCHLVCHAGECTPCQEKITQDCFCGRSKRFVSCGDKQTVDGFRYSCESVCDNLYGCGIHHCDKNCHEGECGKCPFDPTVVKRCCCGSRTIEELSIIRNSCTDPLPVCGDVCGKRLPCGEGGGNHLCKSLCHSGSCPDCPLSTSVQCRCGASVKSVPCSELSQYSAYHPLLCERRCSKKRTCKQHRCGEVCCIDQDHICAQICGRKLPCGIHTCEALCHGGRCRPCLQASFEELTCMCGASVIYPPVRCGTKPPACDMACTRQHACQHPVTHNCHSEDNCPPCTFLTEKLCYGKHEMRRNIPCYLDEVSCGRPCGQPLPCGQHSCVRSCHAGPCQVEGEQCSQPCVRPKSICGHPCAVKCHGETPCPEERMCEFVVKVTCKCGHESANMVCFEIDRLESRRMLNKAAKSDVCLDDFSRQDNAERYKCLDCTDECARIERNRRFVQALDIKTDDLVGELGPPSYTDFLKEQFKLCSDFVLGIEKTLSELVTSADKSKQPSRSHVFPPMNRNQRRIIHEYAPYFEVDTVAYDQEPKRNVVATAKRGKSKIPTILLSTVIQKENGKQLSTVRVVPPKANQSETKSVWANMKTLQLTPGTTLRR